MTSNLDVRILKLCLPAEASAQAGSPAVCSGFSYPLSITTQSLEGEDDD